MVSIQFDDGYADAFGAMKILHAHGMHATFFINTGYVGTAGRMTWKQIAKLDAAGPDRPCQRAALAAQSLPRIRLACQPAVDGRDREPRRSERAIRHLPPGKRRGHRRPRPGPDRVGRHGGLGVSVAHDVDVQATSSLRLSLLERHPTRISRDQHPGDAAGEGAGRVRVRPAIERHRHVDPLPACGLGERWQSQLVQQQPEREGGHAGVLEVIARRIEVEDHLVRVIRTVRTRQPDMWGDARLVRQVHQRRGFLAHELVNRAPLLPHRDARYPGREVPRDVLLEDALTPDPVGVALHRHRAALQVRQHPGGDAPVVIDEVVLGDAVAREQDLVRIRDLDGPSVGMASRFSRGSVEGPLGTAQDFRTPPASRRKS